MSDRVAKLVRAPNIVAAPASTAYASLRGLAALHVAAKHGHASLVETLLGHNAALEAKDGFGQGLGQGMARWCEGLPL